MASTSTEPERYCVDCKECKPLEYFGIVRLNKYHTCRDVACSKCRDRALDRDLVRVPEVLDLLRIRCR
jgi:hypothetical protein